MGKELHSVPSHWEDEDVRRKVFRKKNGKKAVFLVLAGLTMFVLHIIVMRARRSWVVFNGGLTYHPGNLPSGNNLVKGIYADVRTCYAVAKATPDVFGFVWIPLRGSNTQVTCEFKGYSTELELQDVLNRTAVVKLKPGSGCGVFECSGMLVTNTYDLFNCSSLRTLMTFNQVLFIVTSLFLGGHLLLFILLRTNTYGTKLRSFVTILPKTLIMQAGLLITNALFLALGFSLAYCSRQVEDFSYLNYGTYFTIGNCAMCWVVHHLVQASYSYAQEDKSKAISTGDTMEQYKQAAKMQGGGFRL